ncbi:6-deoxyerythronolide-B synthase EryA2, modules 3 and 4 [Streptomyces sp. RB5]|uniref:6-deoxyerythronolide-B synthase EryA2, modules 3 and 4 n=1 Tax=Streptomyces smaragdinus TaxID=2585196 RepID=A0A7K0CKT0_9ACTN|nr:type I polyketide synthase [Streptomyces smaragdinus]MQY14096.1 6-deoxyerythronolide-B synthase EryA2, modules 3 and 4 [Streptomyces smaragdinus]
MDEIAVVGIDCAFPGATGTEAYWTLLMSGGDVIGPVPGQRWDPADFPGTPDSGGFLADADAFDADFFSVVPRDAAAMDPHHRLLLHCAWRALENSGRAPGELAGSDTGVFVGVMGGEWGRLTVGGHGRMTPQHGAGSSAGMAANRISYHFDFTGPSLAVDTACSSSLVAVHLAAGALRAGECDTALAGGVNVQLSPALGEVYAQMGLAARDGRCKPFGASADGIGRGDGVGLVVLRRLGDAIADGQRIYAVLRGSAVNQDGRSNGITAPNRWSQQRVIDAAYRRAGVAPADVRFLEAHGTGTALGDAIECAALGTVHGVERAEPCAIGSVKGNLGHTEGAAGIASLIKTALALHHGIVPASRYADQENPQLRLAARGLRLLKSPLRLPPGESVAGVSSFGMGGTNAHAVLATAPRTRGPGRRPARARGERTAGFGVFTLSADTPEALARNLAAQAEAVARRPRGRATGLCWSSNLVKTGLPYRFAVAARDSAGLTDELRAAAAGEGHEPHRPWRAPVVALLFTGQGAEFPGMTAGLYRDSHTYRQHLDEADKAIAPHLGLSVRELVLGGDERVLEPRYAHPASFAVGWALAATLGSLGVRPAGVLGHSAGEYAAAVHAGALELDEAARLVVRRAELMARLPDTGGMLAVGLGAEEIGRRRDEAGDAWRDVTLAVVNGPHDTVLSGPRDTLRGLAERFAAQGVRTRLLAAARAFHSPDVAPVAAELRTEPVACNRPVVPYASTRYGRLLGEEPLDAAYWAGQAERPVLFDDALGALVATAAPTHLIEVGPRPQLLPLAGRTGRVAGLDLLHPAHGPDAAGRELAELVAALYRGGLDPVWEALYAPEERVSEPLRPYEFATGHRFWDRQAGPGEPAAAPVTRPDDDPGAAGSEGDEPPDEVLAAVTAAVAEVGGHAREKVVRGARFYEDLGFDSVMIMQLKDRVEHRLPQAGEVSVQELLPALRSVGSLADFLSGLVMANTR